MAWSYGCFEDGSVRVGDIDDDDRSSESIRRLIRDEYLLDTEVTILLCGAETRHRKHVDWELKSSMIDGQRNRKSGILVINLPVAGDTWYVALPDEQSTIYADYTGELVALRSCAECQKCYPLMPERIIDQLLHAEASVSVVPWKRVANSPDNLRWLVDQTASAGRTNDYDLSRPMRRRNHIQHTGIFGA